MYNVDVIKSKLILLFLAWKITMVFALPVSAVANMHRSPNIKSQRHSYRESTKLLRSHSQTVKTKSRS